MGRIYNSFFGNIDIFACGILLNFINLSHINLSKHCIYRLFFCFILINIFIYSSGNSILLFIYEAIFPTIYLSFATLILLMRESVCYLSSIINKLAALTYQIYLWHNVIYISIKSIFTQMDTPLNFEMTIYYYILSIIVIIICASLFHAFFEKKHFRFFLDFNFFKELSYEQTTYLFIDTCL